MANSKILNESIYMNVAAYEEGSGGSGANKDLSNLSVTGEAHFAKPVTTTTFTNAVTLADNTIFNSSEESTSALTITAAETPSSGLSCLLNFTSGSTATTLSVPAGFVMQGANCTNGVFTPAVSKKYSVLFMYENSTWIGMVIAY